MGYSIEYNDSLGIIELLFEGTVLGEELRLSTNDSLALQIRHKVDSILVDSKDLDSAPHLDEFRHLTQQYEKDRLRRSTKIALVLPGLESEQSKAHFYVRFCKNRGWNARLFETRSEAIDWLTSKKS